MVAPQEEAPHRRRRSSTRISPGVGPLTGHRSMPGDRSRSSRAEGYDLPAGVRLQHHDHVAVRPRAPGARSSITYQTAQVTGKATPLATQKKSPCPRCAAPIAVSATGRASKTQSAATKANAAAGKLTAPVCLPRRRIARRSLTGRVTWDTTNEQATSRFTGCATSLLDPVEQLRSLPLVQGRDHDVTGSVGGPARGRRVEVRAAEEEASIETS